MADALDHDRLHKLHERATRTGSGHDREMFTRAALEVVPELLAERDRARIELRTFADELNAKAAERDADAQVATVCDRCLKASCWHMEFPCDDSREAGTVDLPVLALRMLRREHEDYWKYRTFTPMTEADRG